MHKIFFVTKKEMIQIFRDRRMLAVLFIAPVVQLIVFGFAVNLDLTAQPTVIADMDRTETSRHVAQTLDANAGFDLVDLVSSPDEAEKAIWMGRAAVAVVIPRGYEKDVEAGKAEIAVALDGSDANSAMRAGQEIEQILNTDSAKRLRAAMDAGLSARGMAPDRVLPSIRLEPRALFNPALRTAVFLVPGVLAMVLLIITMMLTSMGLTREKEIGTLEQIMVTPLKPFELIAGKILPFALLGLGDVILVLSMAVLIFHVPMKGSIPAVFSVSAVFLMTTLGLGLFISTIAATQQQAMMNSLFIVMPAVMLSGYVFPIEHMPEPAQWIAALNPMTYYIRLVRGLMVKGASVADLGHAVLCLTALGSAVFIGASARFKKRMA